MVPPVVIKRCVFSDHLRIGHSDLSESQQRQDVSSLLGTVQARIRYPWIGQLLDRQRSAALSYIICRLHKTAYCHDRLPVNMGKNLFPPIVPV